MYIIPSFHPLVMIIIIIDDKNNDSDNAVFIIGELCLEFRATLEVDFPF